MGKSPPRDVRPVPPLNLHVAPPHHSGDDHRGDVLWRIMAGDGVSLGTLVRRRRRWAQRWGRVCTGFVGIDAAAGVVEGWAGAGQAGVVRSASAEQAGAVGGCLAGAGCWWKRGPGRGPVQAILQLLEFHIYFYQTISWFDRNFTIN